jgi:hypothetical protein
MSGQSLFNSGSVTATGRGVTERPSALNERVSEMETHQISSITLAFKGRSF